LKKPQNTCGFFNYLHKHLLAAVMKMAHLIMAYKYPGMIERMIRTLSYPGFTFYIHLDKKINSKEFDYLSGISNVYFIKNRVRVRWASFRFSDAIWSSV